MKSSLVQKIKEHLIIQYKNIQVEICDWFPPRLAYHFLTGEKYQLTHQYDPPWDNSGTLISVHGGFHFNDYETVGDFLKEYDGNSYATYISGSGLNYSTYYDHYLTEIEEKLLEKHVNWIKDCGEKIILALANEVLDKVTMEQLDLKEIIYEIMEEIDELNGIYYQFGTNPEKILLELAEADFLFIYKKGEREAVDWIQAEQVKAYQLQIEEEINRKKAAKMWSLLAKKYHLMYQEPIPKRLDMKNYELFKGFLDAQHVTKEERMLISKYAPISLSNKVVMKLQLGE